MLDLAHHFSRFAAADPERIHFAAHSHHYWPDVTYEAQKQYWDDSARYADEKWDLIFGRIITDVRKGIARILTLPDPATIAFAPNTHDFLRRLLSALPANRSPRILTTDSEFHTVTRQLARLEEDALVLVDRVAAEPFETFPARFAAAMRADHDLIYCSQVFFNSGASAGSLEQLAAAAPSRETLIAIDGYHGFMAVPTDLSALAHRVFYLAGGYKYAMAGEGVCFMHCPPEYAPRPRDTGWFAAFGALASGAVGVPYGEDGSRFLGATFDPSGLYRLRSVIHWMEENTITVERIHEHVVAIQNVFLATVQGGFAPQLSRARLVTPLGARDRAHFLAFQMPDAQELHDRLLALRIVTDVRGDRIRFGFGCYHRPSDVERAVERISKAPSFSAHGIKEAESRGP
ncbi:aminotransferase class V-fold PLP-dependent enzyme [Microvirga massiliensis]|uniref:aminotransferase class V-fold PLP-dependent enzyme n=1 Tax=Microvirga massiliensis TaxID=1033741 RepID=UPI00062BA122|nr:aminotransferase class V-fold PLP-dependent enzyme [Microvirga massiliensis]